MTLNIYKGLAAGFILMVSIISIIYPLKKYGQLTRGEPAELGEALASGIFLGAAFFHMLPDAIKLFAEAIGPHAYPVPELVCVAGFLFLLFLERLSLLPITAQTRHSIPYILTLILVIHALVEGAALGMGGSLSETAILFIAILAHKGSESFALGMALVRQQLSFNTILFIVILFACMTPLGIGLGTELITANSQQHILISALFNAFAAGTFLYISTLHHIHFHKHADESQGLWEYGCLLLGTAIMGGLAFYT